MLKYIEIGGPASVQLCQHLLRGWMKYVAPLTPSTVDGVLDLECVRDAAEPVKHIPHSIYLMLASIAMSECCGARLCASTIPLVSQAWPTIWIWIQYMRTVLYFFPVHETAWISSTSYAAKRKAFMAKIYQIFVKILRMFSEHDGEPMVSAIVASNPDVLDLMADMWIKEGTDKSAVNGFRCGIFAKPREAGEPRSEIQEKFLGIIIAVCGTGEKVIEVACQRVERHVGQAKREYELLSVDLGFFVEHLLHAWDGSPITAAIYTSSGVAATLMRTWAHITSASCTAPAKIRSEVLHVCLFATFLLVQRSPYAYDRILDVLHQNLLPLLMKSVSLVYSTESSSTGASFTTYATAIIQDILSPATVHRKVLSLVGRYVDVVIKRDDVQALKITRIKNSWASFLEVVDERQNVFKLFKESPGRLVLCCNFKVSPLTQFLWHILIPESV